MDLLSNSLQYFLKEMYMYSSLKVYTDILLRSFGDHIIIPKYTVC